MENLNEEQIIDILDKMDFFQGQRVGRELWNDKPFDVQEQDIANFSRDVALIKKYIKELTKENERLKAQKYMAYPDGRVEMIPNAESVKADTVSNLKARMAIQFGTYTGKDTIPIKELFDVLDKVCEEILDEDHD